MPSSEAAAIIEKLSLIPHPEGGWYRETWRAQANSEGGVRGTAIHFLLEAGQRSHWHKVSEADEIWFWHAGAPLTVSIAESDTGPITRHALGPDVLDDQSPQVRVPAGFWQSSDPFVNAAESWSLVSCVVVPGFEFANFELAPPEWSPG